MEKNGEITIEDKEKILTVMEILDTTEGLGEDEAKGLKQAILTRIENPSVQPIPETWKSECINKLAMALSQAQSEMKGAQKNAVNPFFKSNYADLHKVIESSFPYLTKHGLSVIQGNESKPGEFWVTTMLLHESGQWIKSKLKMPIEKLTAQGVGSVITYGRRYGLSAMVGIAQHDDDAQSIS